MDDEYISGDNKHYVVIRVDKKKEAYTRLKEKLPFLSQHPAV